MTGIFHRLEHQLGNECLYVVDHRFCDPGILGSPDKHVAENEADTVVVQRRCLRAAKDLKVGEVLTREAIDVLRPAQQGAIMPYDIEATIGTKVIVNVPAGEALRWTMLGAA